MENGRKGNKIINLELWNLGRMENGRKGKKI